MDFINRFKEPSTWAAIAAAFIAVGLAVDQTVIDLITQVGTGVAALLGVFLSEGPSA